MISQAWLEMPLYITPFLLWQCLVLLCTYCSVHITVYKEFIDKEEERKGIKMKSDEISIDDTRKPENNHKWKVYIGL